MQEALKANREELANGIEKLSEKLETRLTIINDQLNRNAKANRDEISQSLKDFQEAFTFNIKSFNELQNRKFDQMTLKQDELV